MDELDETQNMLKALQGFNFNEAPASLNFYGVTRRGWNVQITLRDNDERALMERFIHFSNWLEEKGVTPKPVGQQPAPAPDPSAKVETGGKLQPKAAASANGKQEDGETKVIDVTMVKKVINENGKTMVKVFGAPYLKYGVIAWPEAVGELFDIEQMIVGNEYDYSGKATVLLVDGKPKKVLSFA